MTAIEGWFSKNQTLIYFLVAQTIALGAAGISIVAYSVRLETRVTTLEVRGSPHLEKIDAIDKRLSRVMDAIHQVNNRLDTAVGPFPHSTRSADSPDSPRSVESPRSPRFAGDD